MQSREARFDMAVTVCTAEKIRHSVPMGLWLLSWALPMNVPSAGDHKVVLQQ